MTQLNPLTTAEVPPLPIYGEPDAEGVPTVTGWRPGYRHDGDPKYRGALHQYEVAPAVQAHDFGQGAVKWEAATADELLAAAVAAVEAGTAPADLVVEISEEEGA